MFPENDRFRDFLGVTKWHAAGYTGKRGLTADGEDWINDRNDDNHAYKMYSVFKEFALDREVIHLPWIADDFINISIPQIISKKVDTMWLSMQSTVSGAVFDDPMLPTLPFFTYFMSAGNKDYRTYNEALDGKYIYGVGAYSLMAETNAIVRAYYSSVTDEVDFCAPTLVYGASCEGGDAEPIAGTSPSGAIITALAALVNDFFIDKTGKPLSSQMMYQFLRDCAKDAGDAGKDPKYGWGAPILPDPATVDIGRYAGEMYSSRNIDDLRPDVAANCHTFVELCKAVGYPVLVTGTVRDNEYQALCFYKGTSSSAIPSFHSAKAGLAFDICKNVKGQEYSDNAFWAGVGAIGQKMGFNWGGAWTSFVDKPHFQWSDHGRYTSSMIRAGNYPPTMPLYEEDEDMTQDTFNTLYNGVNPIYATIDDVPAYWQEETRALVTSGKLKGDGTGNLNIRHETLRAVIIGER